MASNGMDIVDDDSEWEYEYHETETETFYLNLDLTTYNGPLRAPRKRAAPKDQQTFEATTANPAEAPGSPPLSPPEDNGEENDNGDESGEENNNNKEDNEEQEREDRNEDDVYEGDLEQIQVMELHSPNPIVSYQNHIFSCEWADLIGTEMVFMHPEGYASNLQRLKQTQNYDLLAANTVKLFGRKANLVTASQNQDGKDSSTKPLSNQARFVERLKEIKRAKGEDDTVRTSLQQRRHPVLTSQFLNSEAAASSPSAAASITVAATSQQEKSKAWARTGQQLAKVNELKRLALQGDDQAMAALESMMAKTVEEAAAEAESYRRGQSSNAEEGPSSNSR